MRNVNSKEALRDGVAVLRMVIEASGINEADELPKGWKKSKSLEGVPMWLHRYGAVERTGVKVWRAYDEKFQKEKRFNNLEDAMNQVLKWAEKGKAAVKPVHDNIKEKLRAMIKGTGYVSGHKNEVGVVIDMVRHDSKGAYSAIKRVAKAYDGNAWVEVPEYGGLEPSNIHIAILNRPDDSYKPLSQAMLQRVKALARKMSREEYD